jgi:hypothetical protein
LRERDRAGAADTAAGTGDEGRARVEPEPVQADYLAVASCFTPRPTFWPP